MNLIEALESEEPVQWKAPHQHIWKDNWKSQPVSMLLCCELRKKSKRLSDEPWPDDGWSTHRVVGKDGKARKANMKIEMSLDLSAGWLFGIDKRPGFECEHIGEGYDTDDWQNSQEERPKSNPHIALERWEGKRIVCLPLVTDPVRDYVIPKSINGCFISCLCTNGHEIDFAFYELDEWRELTEAENFLVDYKGVKMTHPKLFPNSCIIPEKINDSGYVMASYGGYLFHTMMTPLSEYVPYVDRNDWSTPEFWRKCYEC
jgi:hypothetical protein